VVPNLQKLRPPEGVDEKVYLVPSSGDNILCSTYFFRPRNQQEKDFLAVTIILLNFIVIIFF
jgi:hypothetical protein